MFHGMISFPGYSELIQDNVWRIKPWHRGNIQDNGLVWHLWFHPTLSVQHKTPVISRIENKLFTFFYKKYDYTYSYYICRQWNGTGSWNSPSRNARTPLFAGSITCILKAWLIKYPRHQKGWYGHGIDRVYAEYHFAFLAILMFLKKQWFFFNSVENSLDCYW